MPAVPVGPTEKGVDRRRAPPARVAAGEPPAPDLVGHVDQTYRGALQQWR
ncbi:hypothetical protein ABZ532_30530 [Streptomyces sp. NPDC019396]